MTWCKNILANEDGMKDKKGWQVVDVVFLEDSEESSKYRRKQ